MSKLENQSIIAKQIAREYFGNVIENIDEVLDSIKFETTISSSNFDYAKKTVFINARYTNDVNHFVHELFHAISTNYYPDSVQIGFNNKSFKGFSKDLLLETSYGYALNEGATHSFTRDATAGKFGEINPISSYNFCANIFKNLENCVGKDKMKFLYTNCGVKDFIDVVAEECHTSKDNVLKLVLNMDMYLDTYRIYSVFIEKFDSEDASSLLSNCYTYLSKIISDKNKAEGKKFDISTDISLEHLSDDEKILYKTAVEKIDKKDLSASSPNTTIEMFEEVARQIYEREFAKDLKSFKDIPDECKCAEFYNFLLLNNYLCNEDRIRKDILKGDVNASLTQKIFAEKYGAFLNDKNLPNNIRTLLSTRYTVRAGCNTSDYYMKECLNDEKFATYLKNTDSDYYEALVNLVNQEEMSMN